jgi:hypothetical protein
MVKNGFQFLIEVYKSFIFITAPFWSTNHAPGFVVPCGILSQEVIKYTKEKHKTTEQLKISAKMSKL